MMEIIPVLDLMSGMAVSGKSGHRETYQPLKTVYSSYPDPVQIASSLKRQGAHQIYIADLDAIEKKGSNLELIRKINHILPVMMDWGVKDLKSFEFALEFANKIIVATETLKSLGELSKIFEKFPKDRIVVSVDIKNDQLLAKEMDISLNDFKEFLIDLNPSQLILLDISQVGTFNGFNKQLIDEFSEFKDSLIFGGGITPSEIKSLNEKGLKKVLVGSALHKGDIPLKL
ncbi:MAG: HisA/HisF family protein [Methanobacteriales archaeon HGW-Methanobacteriales-1]|jgi:phosphoribosylformimino-5-aminoimidazole carboxamide ribotide isomerase|nr:MAG: HisA/HisF family protein [Methanobacteriales archaeon HGW-Methanobacteriales-1]